MPLTPAAEETAEVRRSANRTLATMVVLVVAAVLALGVVMWRLVRLVEPDASDEGPAAAAMDDFAPIAEVWVDQRDHITDEAELGNADGVILAVDDAVAWTEIAVGDVAEIAGNADGGSAPLYDQLVGVFDSRLDALRSLEATGGATVSSAWVAGDARLDTLGAESDGIICRIAGEMRDEGDDPDAHITPAMDVDC